jgi:transcriptional regulator with XRE-family HTH domain
MSGKTTEGTAAEPIMRTLADKVNWLIERAHPRDRGPCTNAEVAVLIERTTGQQVSHTTVWKLRNGQATNPRMNLIEAMARTFRVPPGFFFEDNRAGLQRDQVELLALVRDSLISSAQLRVILGWSAEVRRAVINLIVVLTAHREAQCWRAEGESLAPQQAADKARIDPHPEV